MSDADLAFTYAWWLTGDAETAEVTVRRAWERVRDAEDGQRQVALLEAVREDAIDRPTMCPASELAVLHDAHGLDLPVAARLARIDPADARVELAHGRLEALLETVREPFAHPERLGGLAVGNPPDVAHTRQCDSCATVARLLRQGRDALREIPPPPTPDALRELIAAPEPSEAEAPEVDQDADTAEIPVPREYEPATDLPQSARFFTTPQERAPEPEPEPEPGSDPEPEPKPEPEAAPAADAEPEQEPETEVAPEPETEVAAETDAEPAPEPLTTGEEERARRVLQFDDTLGPIDEAELGPAARETPPRRRNWLLPAVVVLAIALLAVTLGTALRPSADVPAPEESAPPATLPTSAQPDSGAAPPAGFAIDAVGLLRRGEFVPAGPGLVLTPTDRVRLAVRYGGATDGVMLEGHWTVDGVAFRELRVALSSRQSMHVFTAPVPADGWPAGLHQVVMTVGGAVVASIDFRVV